MKVLVCGATNWSDRDLLFSTLDDLHGLLGFTELIEGCAHGADELAGGHAPDPLHRAGLRVNPHDFEGGWALSRGVPFRHFPADWAHKHRAAGPIRNSAMLAEKPDLVVAFSDNLEEDRGTADTVHKAEKFGVMVIRITHKDVRRAEDFARIWAKEGWSA